MQNITFETCKQVILKQPAYTANHFVKLSNVNLTITPFCLFCPLFCPICLIQQQNHSNSHQINYQNIYIQLLFEHHPKKTNQIPSIHIIKDIIAGKTASRLTMASSARNHRLYLLIILSCFITSSSGQEPESTLLLKFKSSLENATSSLGNWNSSVHLCNGNVSNWNGLLCFNGKFIGLRLESMGLSGNLDVDTLSQLTNLRTISVMNNNFEGPFPEVKKIGGRLRGVYLSNNQFSGELPDDAFAGMKSMRRVLMANNEFTGKIPTSLLAIPKLVELQVQNNKFNGLIPAFPQQDFQLNVANNRLEGPIPSQLSSQSATSFAG